ncbi:MAG: efflux RND transporter periplasmic adaptor subunit [Burkholderiaceae bacterium]
MSTFIARSLVSAKPPCRTHPLGALLLSGALALLLAGCKDEPPPAAPQVQAPIMKDNQLRFPANHPQLALLGIETAKAGRSISVELPAKLVWNEERTQRIYAPFAGRVNAIKVNVGEQVKSGTVLAELASPDFGVAQADTAKAGIDAALSVKALARQRELFDAGITARKDLEAAQADADRARAESARAQARTKLYGGRSGVSQELALRSNIAGLVVDRNINPGQELRPDQSGPGVPPLFVISDPSSLWVQIDARESEAATVTVGSKFGLKVQAFPDLTFEGTVIAVSDSIDPTTRTIKVRGITQNPSRKLKAEMLATAVLQRQMGEGVLIPASAVVLRGTEQYVYEEVEPGVFEPRKVKLSYDGPTEVIVSSGLEVGDRVVATNPLLLSRLFASATEDAKPTGVAATPSTASKAGSKP